jgi:outer membrane protein TolC
MKRWGTLVTGLLVSWAAALAGCDRQCLVKECDADHYRAGLRLAAGLEDAHAPVVPASAHVPEPATVLSPERRPYHLSLREAIALALEHGTVGVQSNRLQGVANDDLVQFTGQGLSGTDSIRVLAIDPAVVGANVEGALSRFDPLWTTGMNWITTDEPSEALIFPSPGSPSLVNGQAATFSTSLAKPLPTGGVAGITFSTNYNFLPPSEGAPFGPFNPVFVPRLQFGFEQPLWRDYGVEVNQLLPAPALSALFPGLNLRRPGLPPEGILVSRVRFDQSRAEFERNVNFLLLNVETAYWNLYGSYVTLFSTEQALRQAQAAWQLSKRRYDRGDIDRGDLALSQGQYEQFRGDRLQALEAVLENERTLRILLGLPTSDGKQLVPIDAPTVAPYQPNWDAALQDAMSRRPELTLARDEIRAKQLNLDLQKNYLKPDLRFVSTYSAVGMGSRLDGSGEVIDPATGQPFQENALRSLASGHFTDWSAGLTMNMSLGFRLEHALIRQARLQLLQSHLVLKDQEMKAQAFLARQYGQLLEAHQRLLVRQAQRKAFAVEVATRAKKFAEGNLTIDFLLDAQRQWAAALTAEAQAVVDYNNALARFEFAKGTITDHDSVVIGEGPLPRCAQVRAVEHERERTKALVVRERARPAGPPAGARPEALPGPPCLPAGTAPSLVDLFGTDTPGQASRPDQLPETLPPPEAPPSQAPPVGFRFRETAPPPELPPKGPARSATHILLGFQEVSSERDTMPILSTVVALPLAPGDVPLPGKLGQPSVFEGIRPAAPGRP